jgi:hypothetical protein
MITKSYPGEGFFDSSIVQTAWHGQRRFKLRANPAVESPRHDGRRRIDKYPKAEYHYTGENVS